LLLTPYFKPLLLRRLLQRILLWRAAVRVSLTTAAAAEPEDY
jgi:hypothetical protein